MQRQPTLLNSCASAATAAEARFRIDYPIGAPRASRIIALDDRAAEIVRRLATQGRTDGHFLVFESVVQVNGSNGHPADAALRTSGGAAVRLVDELQGADVVVMVATAAARPEAASVIGDACATMRVMSAGLVLATEGDVDGAVTALRPNAMVLVVLRDETDVLPILAALRV